MKEQSVLFVFFYLCFKFHIAFCVLRLQGYNLMEDILAEND